MARGGGQRRGQSHGYSRARRRRAALHSTHGDLCRSAVAPRPFAIGSPESFGSAGAPSEAEGVPRPCNRASAQALACPSAPHPP